MLFPFRGHCQYAVSHCCPTAGGIVLIKVLTDDIPVTHCIVGQTERSVLVSFLKYVLVCEGTLAAFCGTWLFVLDPEKCSSPGLLSPSVSIDVLFLFLTVNSLQ